MLDEPEEEMLLRPLAVKLSWLREILFSRGEVEEARAIGNWLQQRSSRKRKRKTEEDLRQGKRRRDRRNANRTRNGNGSRLVAQPEQGHTEAKEQTDTRFSTTNYNGGRLGEDLIIGIVKHSDK